ncbi:uncharacterized protein LOC119322696 isoform X6 [Triticum dicoccoides]|uniref:uncharacterized protein LOC119322696 isoform X6 n=1 Tax=Triticum dicoccoides TaxID=85692 RepID=UPI001890AAE7|nr:uncharacterized protein LOC119322696 isoform X6 [Triticum dicoccoides]
MPSASASASSRQGCGMWDVCPSATTGRTRWQRASPRAREEMTLQLKGASLPEGSFSLTGTAMWVWEVCGNAFRYSAGV